MLPTLPLLELRGFTALLLLLLLLGLEAAVDMAAAATGPPAEARCIPTTREPQSDVAAAAVAAEAPLTATVPTAAPASRALVNIPLSAPGAVLS
jgi:hypothetical protein